MKKRCFDVPERGIDIECLPQFNSDHPSNLESNLFRSLVFVPFAALTACASPTPPSVSATDIAAADAERQRISLLPDVAGADLPTSSVTYSGNFPQQQSDD